MCKKKITLIVNEILVFNNKNKSNFHVTTEGHRALADKIIELLYNRKLYRTDNFVLPELTDFRVGKSGLYEILIDLRRDYQKVIKEGVAAMDVDEVAYEVAAAKRREIKRQMDVVEKTLMKRM